MTKEKKLCLLEEMLEISEGTLKAEMELTEVENWDSMAKLSLIVMIDEEFGKRISAENIKELKTVEDILDLMQENEK